MAADLVKQYRLGGRHCERHLRIAPCVHDAARPVPPSEDHPQRREQLVLADHHLVALHSSSVPCLHVLHGHCLPLQHDCARAYSTLPWLYCADELDDSIHRDLIRSAIRDEEA